MENWPRKRERAIDLSSFHCSYCLSTELSYSSSRVTRHKGDKTRPTSETSSTNTMYSSACSLGFQMTAMAVLPSPCLPVMMLYAMICSVDVEYQVER